MQEETHEVYVAEAESPSQDLPQSEGSPPPPSSEVADESQAPAGQDSSESSESAGAAEPAESAVPPGEVQPTETDAQPSLNLEKWNQAIVDDLIENGLIESARSEFSEYDPTKIAELERDLEELHPGARSQRVERRMNEILEEGFQAQLQQGEIAEQMLAEYNALPEEGKPSFEEFGNQWIQERVKELKANGKPEDFVATIRGGASELHQFLGDKKKLAETLLANGLDGTYELLVENHNLDEFLKAILIFEATNNHVSQWHNKASAKEQNRGVPFSVSEFKHVAKEIGDGDMMAGYNQIFNGINARAEAIFGFKPNIVWNNEATDKESFQKKARAIHELLVKASEEGKAAEVNRLFQKSDVLGTKFQEDYYVTSQLVTHFKLLEENSEYSSISKK